MEKSITSISTEITDSYNLPPITIGTFENVKQKEGNLVIPIDAVKIIFETSKSTYDYLKKKEVYLFKIIQNLLKKNHFLQLSLELAEGQITEEEFENELDSNINKYMIDVDQIAEAEDIRIIANIIKKIGQDFSIGDVAEMFGILEAQIEALLD